MDGNCKWFEVRDILEEILLEEKKYYRNNS